jgi:hypothetical protein
MDDWYDYIYDPNTDWTFEPSDPGDVSRDYNPDVVSVPGDVSRDYNPDVVSVPGDVSRDYNPDVVSVPPGVSGGAAPAFSLKRLLDSFKGLGGKALDFAQTPQGIMSLLAALAAYKDRAKPSGGGTRLAYAGPKPVTRTMTQGAYGPIARFAAQGGLMQAYAQGGHVKMEDGGFVLTKRAVDGAGGPQGLASLVPHARMIRGPGTGTSDSIPASIQGRSGVTPAKVSNGEAYVPRRAVQQAGGPEAMYALMHKLQRRA